MYNAEYLNRINWESILNFIILGTEPFELSPDAKMDLRERIMQHEKIIIASLKSDLVGKLSEDEIESCVEHTMMNCEQIETLNLELGLKIGFTLAVQAILL